ncbi:MAG: hypothetical protein VKK59_01660 [Vampirovibrionales bacterium]|nr:hypothetical protein [Vampirovibrionales bacterium]
MTAFSDMLPSFYFCNGFITRRLALGGFLLVSLLLGTCGAGHAEQGAGWLPDLPGWLSGNKTEKNGGQELKNDTKNFSEPRGASAQKAPASSLSPAAASDESLKGAAEKPAFLPPAEVLKSSEETPSRLPAPAPLSSVKLTQPALGVPDIAEPVASKQNPPAKQMLIDDPKNPYGLTYARNQMSRCSAHVSASRWPEAQACLTPVKDWLIQATEAHINLNKSLTKVRTARAQAELEKQLALNFAVLRDEAFYQQAKIMVAQNRQKEAIKLLVGVVESQPRNQLGVKSYELLQSIGFTERLQLVEGPEEEPPVSDIPPEPAP